MDQEKTKDNKEKIKLNRQLPHLVRAFFGSQTVIPAIYPACEVANVAEILELEPDEEDEDGGMQDIDTQRDGKSLVVRCREVCIQSISGRFEVDF